jgi:hypothetical protein
VLLQEWWCGGGSIIPSNTGSGITFSGRAYPKSSVTLLKDAQVVSTTIAGPDSKFKIELSGLSVGNYNFSVYSEDKNGTRSSLLSFPVSITTSTNTNISGIFIAPSISVDKSEVKKGDNIAIFGQSSPESSVLIQVNSEEEHFVTTPSDKDGVYLYNFDSSILELGKHTTKSKSTVNNEVSSFSNSVSFAVGNKNVSVLKSKCPAKADLNNDCKVNLIDFSIAAFWYRKTLSSLFSKVEAEKLNGDNKITLVDFSIMAFYWTG